jgi:hypothetical protein
MASSTSMSKTDLRVGLSRAATLCSVTLDLNLLGNFDRIIDLDAKVAHSAFDAPWATQRDRHELSRPMDAQPLARERQ